MHYIFESVIPTLVLLLELVGALIIIIGTLKAVYHLVLNKFDFRNEDLRDCVRIILSLRIHLGC